MKNFILNLVKNIFNLEEKSVTLKHLSYSNNNMTKTHIISGATLTLSLNLEKNKEKVKSEVEKLVKDNFKNISYLLEIAEKENCNTYFIKNADKILGLIKEESGFIFPKKGFQALYLNIVLFGKISFKTNPFFVFDIDNKSPYVIISAFYKWYSFKSSLPGLDEKTLSQFKKLYEFNNEKDLNKLSYEEIMAIKQAVAREKEAMEFTIQIMKEYEGSKKVLDNIQNNNGGNI